MADTFGKDKITPKAVLSWDEEPSRMPFTGGQAAFLRNWSYVWSDAQDPSSSKVVGKVGVTKLPAAPGGTSTECLGGSQFGMNAASTKKSAAIDFLSWMSSPATQLQWATGLGLAPSRPSDYDQPALAKSNPFMVSLRDIFTGGTPRPKTPKYSQISLAIQAGVSAALSTGNVKSNLTSTKGQVEQIFGSPAVSSSSSPTAPPRPAAVRPGAPPDGGRRGTRAPEVRATRPWRQSLTPVILIVPMLASLLAVSLYPGLSR